LLWYQFCLLKGLGGAPFLYPIVADIGYNCTDDTIESNRRNCHALNVGRGLDDSSKSAALFTGAVHAREWGGSEICVYFAADIPLIQHTQKASHMTYIC
jgi:hypothetical protein